MYDVRGNKNNCYHYEEDSFVVNGGLCVIENGGSGGCKEGV